MVSPGAAGRARSRTGSAQPFEKLRSLEHLAYPGGRMDDAQRAIGGRRHVECPNQLADSSSVDARDRGQIQDDSTLPKAQPGAHAMTHHPAHGRPKRTRDVNDVVSVRTSFQKSGH